MFGFIRPMLMVTIFAISASGCGLSTFTQRETDPFIRDIFGNAGKPISIMVTDSSRRLVYEFESSPNGKVFCADAPPDTSIAASGAVGGDVTATVNGGAPGANGNGSLGMYRITGASTFPLVRRSQGLQYARDLEAKECVLYATGVTTRSEYLRRVDSIRSEAQSLIHFEIEHGLGQLNLGDSSNQATPPPPPERK
jgi:hypothetical protein